jgi:hypothetical protein
MSPHSETTRPGETTRLADPAPGEAAARTIFDAAMAAVALRHRVVAMGRDPVMEELADTEASVELAARALDEATGLLLVLCHRRAKWLPSGPSSDDLMRALMALELGRETPRDEKASEALVFGRIGPGPTGGG